WNDVDAGIAELYADISFVQGYLPSRSTLVGPSGTAVPQFGDKGFKGGRTTGLTFGSITSVGEVVGPVSSAPGPIWFRTSFTVEGDNGTLFSDHGDSGSAIVKVGTGEVLGLLYAGNGEQTYCCPISLVLSSLTVTLA